MEDSQSAPVSAPGTPPPNVASIAATRAELRAARARIEELELELADFSSKVMEEASKQVGDANRQVAQVTRKNEALNSQIIERDILIEGQKEQLDVLKHMIETLDKSNTSRPQAQAISADISDGTKLERALEFSQWTSPVEPQLRGDGLDRAAFLNVKVAPRDDEQWAFQKKSISSWRFAAQTMAHEVEPALVLGGLPQMNWLEKRAFTAAVYEGSLSIEPINAREFIWATRPSNPCCLCGNASAEPQHARLHILKVPKDNQKYQVGNECILRVRFACEFVNFLRSIFSGLRKLDTPATQQAAWKECVRLRQQLFWSRIGGFWSLPEHPENKNFYLTIESLKNDNGDSDEEEPLMRTPSSDEINMPDAPDTHASAVSSEKVGYPTHDGATPTP